MELLIVRLNFKKYNILVNINKNDYNYFTNKRIETALHKYINVFTFFIYNRIYITYTKHLPKWPEFNFT